MESPRAGGRKEDKSCHLLTTWRFVWQSSPSLGVHVSDIQHLFWCGPAVQPWLWPLQRLQTCEEELWRCLSLHWSGESLWPSQTHYKPKRSSGKKKRWAYAKNSRVKIRELQMQLNTDISGSSRHGPLCTWTMTSKNSSCLFSRWLWSPLQLTKSSSPLCVLVAISALVLKKCTEFLHMRQKSS